MKSKFDSLDVKFAVADILKYAVSLRVVNVYDIDHKTYLIKLARPDAKCVILIESGVRIHLTEFDWQKNNNPSGFSMKLRKHLRGRRLESIHQLGIDRIVDLQFGSGEAAYHVIVELYDRGNIVLTDLSYVTLNILRPRTDDNEAIRFVVREAYPVENAKQFMPITRDRLTEVLATAKPNDQVRKVLASKFAYGQSWAVDALVRAGLPEKVKVKQLASESDIDNLVSLLIETESAIAEGRVKAEGIVTQRRVDKPAVNEEDDSFMTINEEFHPILFEQLKSLPYITKPTFSEAVDEFFSSISRQKLDTKAHQHERQALKKLENVRQDHEKRLDALRRSQSITERKGLLIELNLTLVERAITMLRSALANQVSWSEIGELIEEAKLRADPVASIVVALRLERNHVSLCLSEPQDFDDFEPTEGNETVKADEDELAELFSDSDDEGNDVESEPDNDNQTDSQDSQIEIHKSPPDETFTTSATTDKSQPDTTLNIETDDEPSPQVVSDVVDIDLGISAYANARRYYKEKKLAADKEQRTVKASAKAVKNAELKAKQTMREVQVVTTIAKARNVYWFEKFLWFISSENYLVLGGRDSQQNELLVKRHLRAGDVYVHADLHGATSVVVKNCQPGRWCGERHCALSRSTVLPIPPKTLTEAGTMAVCHSAAWDAKVITSAWWVRHDQVSKTAPTGEYLTTGSFMIRGKKNYLPPTYLVYGFGYLFKIDDSCAANHVGERAVKEFEAVEVDAGGDVVIDDGEAPDDGEVPDDVNADDVIVNDKPTVGELAELVDRAIIAVPSKPSDIEREIAGESAETNNRCEREPNSEPNIPDDYDYTACFASVGVKCDSQTHGVEFPETQLDRRRLGSSVCDEEASVPDGVNVVDNEQAKMQAKPKMSAKERRVARKERQKSGTDGSLESEEKTLSKAATAPMVSAPKRGQRSKLKKIKEKYGEQDDEERALRMKLLASAGPAESACGPKPPPDKRHIEKLNRNVAPQPSRNASLRPQRANKTVIYHADESEQTEHGNEPDDDAEDKPIEEVAFLDTLTGRPLDDDVILFPVPVAAPYIAISNYKYKVKMTPGGAKKGKATKTALSLFLADKTTPQVERDLLKATKDVDLSRNLPGKVKVAVSGQVKQKLTKLS